MYNVCITHEYTRYTVLYNNPFYTVQVIVVYYNISSMSAGHSMKPKRIKGSIRAEWAHRFSTGFSGGGGGGGWAFND